MTAIHNLLQSSWFIAPSLLRGIEKYCMESGARCIHKMSETISNNINKQSANEPTFYCALYQNKNNVRDPHIIPPVFHKRFNGLPC